MEGPRRSCGGTVCPGIHCGFGAIPGRGSSAQSDVIIRAYKLLIQSLNALSDQAIPVRPASGWSPESRCRPLLRAKLLDVQPRTSPVKIEFRFMRPGAMPGTTFRSHEIVAHGDLFIAVRGAKYDVKAK